jgi:hypothetical protein
MIATTEELDLEEPVRALLLDRFNAEADPISNLAPIVLTTYVRDSRIVLAAAVAVGAHRGSISLGDIDPLLQGISVRQLRAIGARLDSISRLLVGNIKRQADGCAQSYSDLESRFRSPGCTSKCARNKRTPKRK